MKLVMAGTNAAGRSYVESSTELAEERVISVWDGPLDDIAERIASMVPDPHNWFEPPPGGVRWSLSTFPPLGDEERYAYKSMGQHLTRTVDFDFLLSGELNCVLDEETVELDAGDFIMMCAANHEWVNRGKTPARLLVVMHQPAKPSA
jgi:mannose-6-phosphate isomerase-like protein (cupin superfamily)